MRQLTLVASITKSLSLQIVYFDSPSTPLSSFSS